MLRAAPFLCLALAAVLSAGAAAAELSAWRFTWKGSGGYRIEGRLAFDARHLSAPTVTERDIACFVIEGFRGDMPVGRWALGQLRPETTWTLTFDPQAGALVVFGPGTPMPQAWNMDGYGRNCGAGGFGFNIGNAAQDICIDGRLIVESQVTPSQPLPARPAPEAGFPPDACAGPLLLGARPLAGAPG